MAEANYPVSDTYKILEGYDIYRSSKLIVALVVVESKFGRDLRFYRWQKRVDKGEQKEVWKVDLARMSVRDWDWEKLAQKAKELKEKHNIKDRDGTQAD